ncbi:hypothetical protein IT881_08815 [Erythrobacter sp. A30-3]|nr:hypothetical protein IT881_08815 [Erythrobacter sp. A30-3]
MTEQTTPTETTTEDVSGLKNKNAELLSTIKSLQTQVANLTQAAEDAKDEAAEAAGDELSKLQRQVTKLERERDQANERADKADGELRTVKVDNAVKAALVANNVRPELHLAVEAMLLRQVESEEGEFTISGKSIEDYTKSYFASKEGQHFVSAPDSSGSGSTGAEVVKTGKPWKKAPQTNEEFHQWFEYGKNNPEQANKLADEWGKPELKPM